MGYRTLTVETLEAEDLQELRAEYPLLDVKVQPEDCLLLGTVGEPKALVVILPGDTGGDGL